MGTIAEKLLQLNATKEEIKNAIEAKGVIVAPENPFSEYPAKISQIGLIPPIRTVRPLDWPDVTLIGDYTNIKLLVKSGTEISFSLHTIDSVPFRIQWGSSFDPTYYPSGETIQRIMDEEDSFCSEGYYVVLVEIWVDLIAYPSFVGYEKIRFGDPASPHEDWRTLACILDANLTNVP